MFIGSVRVQHRAPNRRRKSERGYILVTLTLFVALLAVAAMAIAPSITFQIQRDREEELIHRGVQYSRAIQKYFKKFGRYPTSLNDLENTNNQRFLRKRYKDPITGKDFKLLHYGEAQMMSMGAGIAGATPASAMSGNGIQGTSNSSSPQGFSLGTTATQNPTGQAQPGQGNAETEEQSSSSSGSQSLSQIGGGPIVGVISTSKAKSIREFGGKDHYNQWQFIYDPALDRSAGLINTPAQPALQGTVANVNGVNNQGQPGTQPAGNSTTGFGSFGSNTSPGTQPPSAPSQTPASPQQ